MKMPGSFTARLPLILIALCLLTALVFGGCKETELVSSWTEYQIVIDGKSDDWSSVPIAYFAEENMAVGLTNDSTSLIVLLKTRDPQTARSIRRSGLTLWFVGEGKKRKGLGLRFHDGPTPDSTTLSKLLRGNAAEADRMRSEMSRPAKLLLVDEENDRRRRIAMDGADGPQAHYDTSFGFYTYEIMIPMWEFESDWSTFRASPGQEIAIGAVWKETPQPGKNRPSGGGRGGGPPGGGPGGGGGGKGRGSRGGGGSEMSPPAPQTREVWFKAILTFPDSIKGD